MRRSRVLIAVLCFVLALPLQLIDFTTMGGLAGVWKLISLALSLTGVVLYWMEWRRMKRATEASASHERPEP